MVQFQEFTREGWAARRTSALPIVGEADGLAAPGGVDLLDLQEVYSPLAELVGDRADDRRGDAGPYLVAVVGSVAVGKSTAARALSGVLAVEPSARQVAVVSTDGFLHSNQELAARGLTDRKGFPESYDLDALAHFLSAVQSGQAEVHAPVYSHEVYDVVDDTQVVARPDVLILEGMPLANDRVDLSIYLDAAEADIEQWFVAALPGPLRRIWRRRRLVLSSVLGLRPRAADGHGARRVGHRQCGEPPGAHPANPRRLRCDLGEGRGPLRTARAAAHLRNVQR